VPQARGRRAVSQRARHGHSRWNNGRFDGTLHHRQQRWRYWSRGLTMRLPLTDEPEEPLTFASKFSHAILWTTSGAGRSSPCARPAPACDRRSSNRSKQLRPRARHSQEQMHWQERVMMPSWSGAPDRAMPRNRVIAVPAAKHRLQAGVPITLLREDDLRHLPALWRLQRCRPGWPPRPHPARRTLRPANEPDWVLPNRPLGSN
jgi:hypothetical protein